MQESELPVNDSTPFEETKKETTEDYSMTSQV